jgi:hypothetical protein
MRNNSFSQIKLNNSDIKAQNGNKISINGEINPNEFISTGAADLRYLSSGVSGNFYSVSNPSNYINSTNLNGLASTGYINTVSGSLNEKISAGGLTQEQADLLYLSTGSSGAFYSTTNPSNYINLSNLEGLVNSGNFISGISVSGGVAIQGAFNINAGANITLTQQGSNILEISASAGSTNIGGLISTGDADLRYLQTGVSGEFYKTSNPAGYITNINLNGLISTGSANLTYLATGASGSFYSSLNPSNYITNSNLNGLINTGSADARYYAIGNPNNFSSSGNVQNTGTALQNQLSNYYLNTNSNNFSTSGNVQNTGTALVGLINNLKPFSKGGTIIHNTGISTGNFIVWRSQFPCTVTGVWGYRVGGTNVSFSARKNGTSNHLSVPALLGSPNAWTNGGTVTNTPYVAGDRLEIMVVAVTGAVTQVGVQVDFIKI